MWLFRWENFIVIFRFFLYFLILVLVILSQYPLFINKSKYQIIIYKKKLWFNGKKIHYSRINCVFLEFFDSVTFLNLKWLMPLNIGLSWIMMNKSGLGRDLMKRKEEVGWFMGWFIGRLVYGHWFLIFNFFVETRAINN